MSVKNLIAGLQILTPYWDVNYQMGARDTEILAPSTDRELSNQDIDEMISLGWWQEIEGEGVDEFEAEDYDSDYWWAYGI